MAKNEWILISLGGSIIVSEKINKDFIKKFRDFIFYWLKKGKRFIIFIGGGKTAREYQQSAKRLGVRSNYALDWIGIYATWLNACFIKSVFGQKAFPEVVKNPKEKVKTKKKIIIAGGWKPGWSTDFDAVEMARTYNLKKVINLTNVYWVYDKNPNKFKQAKPIKEITFSEALNIGEKKWKPGLSFPFDPVALKSAQEQNLQVIITKGTNLKNLDNILRQKKFRGTVVKNQ